MKITNIKWESGNEYKISTGEIFVISRNKKDLHKIHSGESLKKLFSIKEILDLDFTLVKQITENELLLYSLLPKDYKWIATNLGGEIFAYSSKPTRKSTEWQQIKPNNYEALAEMSQFHKIITLSWEDEPQYIGDIERL